MAEDNRYAKTKQAIDAASEHVSTEQWKNILDSNEYAAWFREGDLAEGTRLAKALEAMIEERMSPSRTAVRRLQEARFIRHPIYIEILRNDVGHASYVDKDAWFRVRDGSYTPEDIQTLLTAYEADADSARRDIDASVQRVRRAAGKVTP